MIGRPVCVSYQLMFRITKTNGIFNSVRMYTLPVPKENSIDTNLPQGKNSFDNTTAEMQLVIY